MQQYTIPQTKVQPITKPLALTTADMSRLDAADAYYAYAGKGYWTFSQVCSEANCVGYWIITIHETDPDFHKAKERAISGGPCKACRDAAKPTGASLITYAAKSASSGSGNGSSGKTHRNRAGRCGDAKVTRKQIEARIKQLAAMIANPGRNTPEAQIEAWQAEQDALAMTLATWTRQKAVRG